MSADAGSCKLKPFQVAKDNQKSKQTNQKSKQTTTVKKFKEP